MKARRFISHHKKKLELEDFDLPDLPDDGILVENDVTAVSVGTEIYTWVNGGEPGRGGRFPRVTGYCNTGIVLEVGKEVTDIQPGDRVAGQGYHASHSVLTDLYRKVPEGVSARSAAFMVMGGIAIHGQRVGRPELGESVVVLGMGIVGQLAASFAQLGGAMPVIVIDLDDFRLEKAKQRGADVCLNPNRVDDLTAAVQELCVADGADLVIEATGVPAVFPTALQLPRLGGRLSLLSSPRGTVEINLLREIHLREVRILGAHQPRTPDADHIYYPWTKARDRDLVLHLMATGKLSIEDLITHEEKPENCQAVYDMLADNPKDALGVVFDWT